MQLLTTLLWNVNVDAMFGTHLHVESSQVTHGVGVKVTAVLVVARLNLGIMGTELFIGQNMLVKLTSFACFSITEIARPDRSINRSITLIINMNKKRFNHKHMPCVLLLANTLW